MSAACVRQPGQTADDHAQQRQRVPVDRRLVHPTAVMRSSTIAAKSLGIVNGADHDALRSGQAPIWWLLPGGGSESAMQSRRPVARINSGLARSRTGLTYSPVGIQHPPWEAGRSSVGALEFRGSIGQTERDRLGRHALDSHGHLAGSEVVHHVARSLDELEHAVRYAGRETFRHPREDHFMRAERRLSAKQRWTERLRRGREQRSRGPGECILSGRWAWSSPPEHHRKETTMSPQRARMIEDMILAGLAGGTRKLYVQAVRRLAAHYHRSPDLLSEEEVRSYLLALRQRGVARGTFQTSHYGLRFYYQHTLSRAWGLFGEKKDRLATTEAAA
jgi:hypothetical protein